MSNLSSFLTTGAKGILKFLKKPGLSYKGNWVQVYPGTVLDSWHVGDFSTASYLITIEYESNKKELMHVNVVARPGQASYNIFGRTSIDDELVTFDASVTNSIFSLTVSPSDTIFTGARITFLAFYGETINPLTPALSITQSGGGTGGGTGNGGGTGGNTEGGTGIASNSFSNIAVLGQSTVVADGSADTLTLVAGNNILISTNATTDTITISSSAPTLPALSVTTAAAGVAALSYNSGTGIFTFTPPDLSSYVSSTTLTSTLNGYATTSALSSAVSAAVSGVAYSLPIATTSVIGGVRPDGTTITINPITGIISGATTYSLPTAGTGAGGTLGGIKVDGSSITISGGVISTTAGLSSRTTVVATTGSLASTASTTTTVTAAKGYALYSIQVSAGAWVTIYTSSSASSSDSSRNITTDPTPGSGVIAEAITTTATTTYFTPAVHGYNADGTPSLNMYLKIYNNSGTTQGSGITVTITYLKLEA